MLLVYFVLMAFLLRSDLLEALVATVIAMLLFLGAMFAISGVLPPEMARLVFFV
jgi:VIT1/CCC1 family predicted Fe2+/Mn2+ transporter